MPLNKKKSTQGEWSMNTKELNIWVDANAHTVEWHLAPYTSCGL